MNTILVDLYLVRVLSVTEFADRKKFGMEEN